MTQAIGPYALIMFLTTGFLILLALTVRRGVPVRFVAPFVVLMVGVGSISVSIGTKNMMAVQWLTCFLSLLGLTFFIDKKKNELKKRK